MRVGMERACVLAAVLALAACGGGGGGGAEGGPDRASGRESAQAADRVAPRPTSAALPASLAALALPAPVAGGRVDRRLQRAQGRVTVWVSLNEAPVASLQAERLAALGIAASPRARAQTADRSGGAEGRRIETAMQALRAEMRGHRQRLVSRQHSLGSQLQSLGARELARVQLAANAIAVEVEASQLKAMAAMPGVAAIRPVVDVRLDPVMRGARREAQPAAVSGGQTGKGVRIAVLDSGVDYTHYNLGGAGTEQAYQAAVADPTRRRGLFPTAKVTEGHDFVGEWWPDAGLEPDSNPIDTQGHGTHVADIAAGRSADGRHRGIAPDAELIALKVCSAISPYCSGVAILQALDHALDPNRDGDISDAVDVINMSLGSSYGQQEDDAMLAVSRIERLGVVVAVAAGNDGNKPYVVSAPSTAPGSISVAQTTMPDDTALALVIQSPESLRGRYANTETVDWAPVERRIATRVVAVGTACPGNSPGYPANVSGRIALIDEGGCAPAEQIRLAGIRGASGVLFAMSADGDAQTIGSDGGGGFVPTLVITKALADRIRARLLDGVAVSATLSPDERIDISGSIRSTSARGPGYSTQTIKPEIGAPGATVSAVAGSGHASAAFGGTSGATPVVAGAAALLLQARPELLPPQVKALLMNSAERAIYTHKARQPGVLAPITRIGAGELRPARAVALSSLAHVPDARSAALSFGLVEADRDRTLTRTLRIENLSTSSRRYTLKVTGRHAHDAGGAVRLSVPASVTVPARSRRDVTVTLRIDADRLPAWSLNAGALGGQGAALEGAEFDGYVTLSAGAEQLAVPWHVLPRKAADLGVSTRSVKAGQSFRLANAGVNAGGYEVFSLIGTSPDDGEVALPGGNKALVDLRAVGARVIDGRFLQVAINTYGRRAHAVYPAEFDVEIDVDADGWPDFVMYSAEVGGFAMSGQSAVYLYQYWTGQTSTFFYTDADFHSANAILTVPLAALGIGVDSPLVFSVYAFDNYFSGSATDVLTGMAFNPARPRWSLAAAPGSSLAAGRSVGLTPVARAGGEAASPAQQGFLLMYRRDRDNEADVVRVTR